MARNPVNKSPRLLPMLLRLIEAFVKHGAQQQGLTIVTVLLRLLHSRFIGFGHRDTTISCWGMREMPMIRINAEADQPILHNSPRPIWSTLRRANRSDGPVVVMIHGYKYLPGHQKHCPHRHLLSLEPEALPRRSPSWPRQLGFGVGNREEGLAIAFGWQARGAVWEAHRRATCAGRVLAEVLHQIHDERPHRSVHIIAHSMGTEVALEALHHLPAGAVTRILSLNGASYRTRAEAALRTPAGRETEFFNITSRENDPFDFMFESLVRSEERKDRAIGLGVNMPNALTLELDCHWTLQGLRSLGAAIDEPRFRMCHWSTYMRPGVLRFYSNLIRRADTLEFKRIKAQLPNSSTARWSRLFALPAPPWSPCTLSKKPDDPTRQDAGDPQWQTRSNSIIGPHQTDGKFRLRWRNLGYLTRLAS